MKSHEPVLKPSGTGDLNRTPFGHVLLYAFERGMTGSLLVGDGPEVPTPSERSAAIALQRGLIVGAVVDGAVRARDESSLDRNAELLGSLVPLCARTSGAFAFYLSLDLVGKGAGTRRGELHPYHVLSASLRGPAREDVIAAVIEGLGDNVIHLKTPEVVAQLGLAGAEHAFADALAERPAPLVELLRTASLPAPAVRRVLYLLRATRCLALTPAGRRQTSGMVAVPPSQVPRVIAQPSVAPAPGIEPQQATREVVFESTEGGLTDPEPGVDHVFEADERYRDATQLTKLRRYGEAFEQIRHALDLNSEPPQYWALCAWLQHLCEGDPETPSSDTLRLITHALRRGPQCELAHFYNASLLKRAGRTDKAARHFQRVLSINPDNLDAARELRLYSMRSRRPPSDKPRLLERLLSIAPKRRVG